MCNRMPLLGRETFFLPSSERLRALQGMSLETGPTAVFCPSVLTAHTWHLKTIGRRLQVETLEDTSARMSRLLETHPPPKAPFPMGCICYASNDLFDIGTVGPSRSEGCNALETSSHTSARRFMPCNAAPASQLPGTHSHLNHALQKALKPRHKLCMLSSASHKTCSAASCTANCARFNLHLR